MPVSNQSPLSLLPRPKTARQSADWHLRHAILHAQIQQQLQPVIPANPVNVLDFGADPLGNTSSLTAFTNAYNAAITPGRHLPMYAPAGKYILPPPGFSATTQQDFVFFGDGPGMTQLVGGGGSGYTIFTASADTGHGTTGVNLSLSNFSILDHGNGQNGLLVADYLGVELANLLLQASGNPFVMAGVADYTIYNVNALSWDVNAAGNTGLFLKADGLGIFNGPGVFLGCQFEGGNNVTTAGAINSTGTFGTLFSGCLITANGPNITTIAEFANGDDVTLLNCYSESGGNTTNNLCDMFYIGRTGVLVSFTVIGGNFFNGISGHSCNRGIVENNGCPTLLVNTRWPGFATAGFTAGLGSLELLAINNQAPGGAATMFNNVGFPAGVSVPFFKYPALTTGFGTPTGQAVINNFPGATATLLQTSEAVAQLITDLKALGIYGA